MTQESADNPRISYDDLSLLDDRLRVWGLRRNSVPVDGNCFFHAVCQQLKSNYPKKYVDHNTLRSQCVEFLKHNDVIDSDMSEAWSEFLRDESRDNYLGRMTRDGEWVDHIMIKAVACVINCDITIFTTTGNEESIICINPYNGVPDGHIIVGHVAEIHYFSTEQKNGSDMPLPKGKQLNMKEASDLGLSGGRLGGPDRPGDSIGQKPVDVGILISPTQRRKKKLPKRPTFSNQKDSIELRIVGNINGDTQEIENNYDEIEAPPPPNANMPQFGTPPLWDRPERGHEEPDRFDMLDNLLTDGRRNEDPEWELPPLEPPPDDATDGGALLHFATKLAKYISVIVFAGAVLFGALTEKSTLLILANAYNTDLDGECTQYAAYEKFMCLLILMTLLCFPELLTFVYSLYRILFKKEKQMNWAVVLKGLVPEVANAVGISLLIVEVVPRVDATLAILMFSLIGMGPIFIHLHAKVCSITHTKKREPASIRQARKIRLTLCVIALVLQVCGYGLLCWQIVKQNNVAISKQNNMEMCIYTVISLLLTSCRYWENFVSLDFVFTQKFRISSHVTQQELDQMRFKSGVVYSFVRICVIVGMCFFIFFVIDDNKIPKNFGKRISRHDCSSFVSTLWITLIANTLTGLGTFYFGRIACQTMVQAQAYTFPLMLVTPIMASFTATYTKLSHGQTLLQFFGMADSYNPYTVKKLDWYHYTDYGTAYLIAVVLVGLAAGWLAILLVTCFLWDSKHDRLERTEVLFVKPIYGGPLINEEMMLNRRQYPNIYTKNKKKQEMEMLAQQFRRQSTARSSSRSRRISRRMTVSGNRKFIPQVFLCATMWHETKQEMTQLLTSIMRLDRDQGLRRPNSRKDQDYYNFQVHVLFDDAMDLVMVDGAIQSKPNKFVQEMIRLIPDAANKVELGRGDVIPPPVIYPTPYGGKLEFILPFGNMMIVHLKDKTKIRHRKRWSQCMYMYYILGYLQKAKKAYKIEDVFILALDGDVDFQPESLLLLLDRMKRNPDVGAACGRIHPIGNGPVVWFQKFEYAVGHWLQKTAEHVIGCVLCSPGCFSLFRGEALVDVNVVKKYTTKATEALHYIQWDQGEDRWLCTLLLKQGWRIEYCAASDSYTFAPEDFKEFYNQRRRWGPSTMANVFDILLNSKLTVKNNDYISWGYISYQTGLMASSILGPATVVLVVQGAFAYVFGMSAIGSLLIALIPVIIFVILCYTTSQDFQVAVAGILTIIYALVMMAVLVGIIGQMTEALLNPNSLFMIAMIGIYAFTGIIHPTEMMCLIHGMLYYLCVPSAFILLMVYSLCNMNNVSWGTREVKKPVVDSEAQEQALKELASKTNKDKSKKSFQLGPSIYDQQTTKAEGYYSCGLGNLCQCALCIQPAPVYQPLPTVEPKAPRKTTHRPVTGVERSAMIRKYSIAKARFDERQVEDVERSLKRRISVNDFERMVERDQIKDLTAAGLRRLTRTRRETLRKARESRAAAQMLAAELAVEGHSRKQQDESEESESEEYISSDEDDVSQARLEDEEGEGLYWVLDETMEDGKIEFLDNNEHKFWKDFIKKYLEPLDENKAEQDRIKSDLITLRNKMTGAYFLLNALWIVLTFSLTLAISDINITFYDAKGNQIVLQPLAFLFLIFFLVILIIQFTTMLIHRWSTFVHLLSVTTFAWGDSRNVVKNTLEDDNVKGQPESQPGMGPLQQGPSTSADMGNGSHRNPGFEETNFSYGTTENPQNKKYSMQSEVDKCDSNSDASDTYEIPSAFHDGGNHQGSLVWRKETGGIAKSLAATGVVNNQGQEDEDPYAEITYKNGAYDSQDGELEMFDVEAQKKKSIFSNEAVDQQFASFIESHGDMMPRNLPELPVIEQPKANGSVVQIDDTIL